MVSSWADYLMMVSHITKLDWLQVWGQLPYAVGLQAITQFCHAPPMCGSPIEMTAAVRASDTRQRAEAAIFERSRDGG